MTKSPTVTNLLKMVQSADLQDERLFYELLSRVCMRLDISTKDISGAIPVCGETVRRWMVGRNAPMPMSREIVYRFLASKLSEVTA